MMDNGRDKRIFEEARDNAYAAYDSSRSIAENVMHAVNEARKSPSASAGRAKSSGTTMQKIITAEVLIVFITLTLLISALPMNLLGLNSDDIDDGRAKLQEDLKSAYAEAAASPVILKAIEDTFAAEPFNCDGHTWMPELDIHKDSYDPDASYLYFDTLREKSGLFGSSDTVRGCYIRTTFEPELETMMANINAYTSAVNGAISLYRQDDETDEEEESEEISVYEPQGAVISEAEYDEDGNMKSAGEISEEGKKMLESSAGDIPYTDSSSDSFVQEVRKAAEYAFFADRKAYRWEGMPAYNKETQTFSDIETADLGETETDNIEQLKMSLSLSGPLRREIRHHKGERIVHLCADPAPPDINGYDGSFTVTDEAGCPAPYIFDPRGTAEPYDFTSEIITGEIRISMFYSLYDYKKDEINETITNMTGKGRCQFKDAGFEEDGSETCTHEEAAAVMWKTIDEYYYSYAGSMNADTREAKDACTAAPFLNKEEMEVKYEACIRETEEKARYAVFGKIMDDEGYDVIHPWGYTVISIGGNGPQSGMYVLGLDGAETWSGIWDGEHVSHWAQVAELIKDSARTKVIYAPGECTTYAQAWFYTHYKDEPWFDGIYGNGNYMAQDLVTRYPDHFEICADVVPGAIVSVISSKYLTVPDCGHVLAIDAVDWEAGTVTYSDGNSGFAGNVDSIHDAYTVSISQFHENFGTYAVAGPKR